MSRSPIAGVLILLLSLGSGTARAVVSSAPRVGSIVSISADDRTDNEASLAINPTNPLNLLAGWNAWAERQGVGYAYSFDGGRTWSRPALIPGIVAGDAAEDGEGSLQVAGDPAFVFGPDGTAYAVLQAFDVTPPYEARLMVAISSDGGRTWPRLLVAFRGSRAPESGSPESGSPESGEQGESAGRGVPDRATVAIDSSPASPYFGTLYIAFGQEQEEPGTPPVLLVSLRPGASNFSPPVAVSSLPAGFTQTAAPFTAPDGALYVSFVAQEPGTAASAIFVAESRDGGRSFGRSHLVARLRDPVDGSLPNTRYRVSSFAAGAFDPVHRRLVVTWNDRIDGVSSMMVSTAGSLDLGQWSPPARVTAASTGEQFFPALSSSSDGRLDLAFYDRSRDPGNRLNFLTYAWSGDGGHTWESLNVTRAPFDGDAQTTPGGTSFIGDYIAIASTSSAAHLAWTGNGPASPCNCNQDIFTVAISHK